MDLPLDFATLRLIWWGLLGVLLIAFALTDGFDLGVGALLPFVAKTDEERRMVINTVGATWEGNQVWFIVGGAAIFAAWPFVYAVSFSGFYLAMFLVLSALILRPVSFKYRSKRPSAKWRSMWDWGLFIGSFVPALVFGVAVGNVLLGAPFHLDSDLRAFYDGNLLGLFTPFSLIAGLLSVAMLVLHGASWLSVKAEQGAVLDRARRFGTIAGIAALVLFAAGGLYVAYGGLGYRITGALDVNGFSNPLRTTVEAAPGAWLDNYGRYPWMLIAPVLGFLGSAVALVGMWRRSAALAFGGSSLSAVGIISTVGLSMFPFILPSSVDPQSSLTVWNSSSSHLTLFIMLIVTGVFLPFVLLYTAWVYRVLWGRTSTAALKTNPDLY
ncbi:MAG: cytochrome d ubiquinol oxidase subunit II [Candidatus Brevundimonas colombiensis]|jgi:cytochrome d ubiquinol oxidase subunit II|uniref:Cytochrome d ubiquinol oxidase subunit II n=1 Tax=Candidatus Brevundimonas colombiensis TaxID=3121376 RepID=A0AAJ5X443_9CAUL|nr:cytochrome d ubiquinol oxidase subunit II [Brevundimonas sp.]WEK39960.1 MAG: cytochrome d ubiquinol oxidase subunit II [Brevundimonas sp.]